MTLGELLEDVMNQAISDDGQPLTMLVCDFSDQVDSDGDDYWSEQ